MEILHQTSTFKIAEIKVQEEDYKSAIDFFKSLLITNLILMEMVNWMKLDIWIMHTYVFQKYLLKI